MKAIWLELHETVPMGANGKFEKRKFWVNFSLISLLRWGHSCTMLGFGMGAAPLYADETPEQILALAKQVVAGEGRVDL